MEMPKPKVMRFLWGNKEDYMCIFPSPTPAIYKSLKNNS